MSMKMRQSVVRDLGRMLVVAGLFGALCMIGISLSGAETISAAGGTAAEVSGLDNLAGTIQEYASGNVGMAIATVMTLAGIGMTLTGKAGTGAAVAGGGIATAFVPSMIGGVYQSTGLVLVPLLMSDAGQAHVLVQGLMVLLFVPVMALRALMDPVAMVLALGVVAALPRVRSELMRAGREGLAVVRTRVLVAESMAGGVQAVGS